MNVELCIRVCREVFEARPWFLLEHGTILVTTGVADDLVIQSMKKIDALIGPHGGEGTPFGDCTPLKLKAFDGWLVSFTALPFHTFVGADEIEEAAQLPESSTEVMRHDQAAIAPDLVQDLRIALFGRHKRNQDVRDPKIIARGTDP